MSQLRLEPMPSGLLNGNRLNRGFNPVLAKVEGEPGVDPGAPSGDAQREAFVAFKIASMPNVTKVLLGDRAYSQIYPQGGQRQTNCDAVGLVRNVPVALGEGKGKDLIKCLRQLTASARAMPNGSSVEISVVAAVAPLYLYCRPGPFSVTDAKGHWDISDSSRRNRYTGALQVANSPTSPAKLDPRYFYLLVPEGLPSELNGIGLAVSRTGDNFLYTNRAWNGVDLASAWGPIRKLATPGTVELYLTAG